MKEKKLVGVKIDEGELAEMVDAIKVESAATAILALARIGKNVMVQRVDSPRVQEVAS